MTEKIKKLTTKEKARLADLENALSKMPRGFYDIGPELIEIREDSLFRESHDTFSDYLDSHRH